MVLLHWNGRRVGFGDEDELKSLEFSLRILGMLSPEGPSILMEFGQHFEAQGGIAGCPGQAQGLDWMILGAPASSGYSDP